MSPQVIGAGFGRTGTRSLKVALEQLGFGPCYHMVECLPQGSEHYRLWEDALAGRPDWDRIFAGFKSTVDFPACTSYAALADHYPEAKVVLSVRDPEKWFESTQQTIFAPHWMAYLPSSAAGPFMKATINDYFDDRMHDREFLIDRFNEHVAAVQAKIPAERLLMFDVRQGWAPLCEFLEVAVPAEPFPRINDSAETQAIINAIIEHGFERAFAAKG
jgi:hypothetical protein